MDFLIDCGEHRITMNVPVVYLARDVMILIGAISITRPLEGVGPVIEIFLGP
jgi:hypothetical protein